MVAASPRLSRRDALVTALAGTAAVQAPAAVVAARATCAAPPRFATGVEGQRRADLGDGRFLNPIVSGDRPDPTILKDGADYYMTFSSFQSYPGAILWHSRDLVNWAPITAALTRPIGTVWAMDLIKHDGRYYLYIPVLRDDGTTIFVTHASDIRGPWSDPVDLKLPGCIDPGHAVGEDGKRYLFVNGIRRVRLADDGLSTDGPLEHACTPWRYPEDWVVEMFAPEGPKIFRRGDWFYLVSAVGGTAGPPTSHMVVAARSRSIHGPWEHCPHNPIVRTRAADEPWWSRGHASVVEGPAGDWWMVYHGYENGYRTLGRQALLEPIEWTADGWFRARGGTLSAPMRKPRGGQAVPAGLALSDDFSRGALGLRWSFFAAGPQEADRLRHDGRGVVMQGRGESLPDCSPLTCIVGDRHYEARVTLDVSGDGHAGLALFYDQRACVGLGFSTRESITYGYGQEQRWMREPFAGGRVHLRVTYRDHVAHFAHSTDGVTWKPHPWQMEVSGLHHNVFGGFLSLRIALFSAGRGEARFQDFVYRGLPG
ncbi:family 43 glycosylhydrolase [Ideonella sp. DXS29W]|uniref:Family 43 glycosylhydrolase n=1 Tax=Ideonella lacteola TaxID=2984193 RepID=A0ABU9BYD1_9BURK